MSARAVISPRALETNCTLTYLKPAIDTVKDTCVFLFDSGMFGSESCALQNALLYALSNHTRIDRWNDRPDVREVKLNLSC